MKNSMMMAVSLAVLLAAGCGETEEQQAGNDAGVPGLDAGPVERDAAVECVPESEEALCLRLSATCGSLSAKDNCGVDRVVADCGSCSGALSCVENACENLACEPACTDVQTCVKGTCVDDIACALPETPCGAVCCPDGEACNPSGVCEAECVAETDLEFCARLSAACGPLTSADNCGLSRSVAQCGACGATERCAANKCTSGCGVPASYGAATMVAGTGKAEEKAGQVVSQFDLNEDPDLININVYDGHGSFSSGLKNGTYTIEGDDLNFATCGLCVAVYDEDFQTHMATGGTVTLTSISGRFTGTLSNATFEQVVFDDGNHTTPVPGGCKTAIDSLSFDLPIEAP